MRSNFRLSLTTAVAALASVVLFTALAQADPTSPRIRFFACASATASNNPAAVARLVPANQPLYVQSGWSSGTRGLVEAALPKIQNTLSVTYTADGTRETIHPGYGPVLQNPDGTWTSLFRIDLPPLAVGASMTIHWTGAYTQPILDVVPPSDSWLPDTSFQPPWDGTGIKFRAKYDPGPFDYGFCTVTAVAPAP